VRSEPPRDLGAERIGHARDQNSVRTRESHSPIMGICL
jgi:hypothetical protein